MHHRGTEPTEENHRECETSEKVVSVLVLNLNGREHLKDCFESLRAVKAPAFEAVLVDNGSTDGSIDYVRRAFPEVRVVAFERNLGFAGAYDRAVRESPHELCLLLNNDVRVAPNFLKPLVRALTLDPSVAIAGSRLVAFADGETVDHAGGRITALGGGADLEKFEKTGPGQGPSPTAFACGAAVLVRKSVFIELGGFDPDYIIYHEDVDLAWRAWMRGHRVVHVPESLVYHKGGALMGTPESPRRLYLSQKNRWRNAIKNFGGARLVESVAVSIAFDVARLARFAAAGDVARIKAVLSADREVASELPQLLSRRREVQRARTRSDAELARLGLFDGVGESLARYRRSLPRESARR